MNKQVTFTDDQLTVLASIKANPDMTNRDIADMLYISLLSVGNIMRPIYTKVGIEGGRGMQKRAILNEMLANGEVI